MSRANRLAVGLAWVLVLPWSAAAPASALAPVVAVLLAAWAVVPSGWWRRVPAGARAADLTARAVARFPLAVATGLITLGLAATGHRSSPAVGAVLTIGLLAVPGATSRALDRLPAAVRTGLDRVDRFGGWALFLLGSSFNPNGVGTGAHTASVAVAIVGIVLVVGSLPALEPVGPVEPGWHRRPTRSWVGGALLVLLATVLAVGLFHVGLRRQIHEYNSDPLTTAHDQEAYTWYAHELLRSPDMVVANRNQMPLYPYLMGRFSDEQTSQQGLFLAGLAINEVVGIVGALAVGVVLGWRASPLAGAVGGLVTGFGLFLMLSGWVLADVLAAVLFGAMLCGLLSLLRRPTAVRGALVGLLAGITDLTKPVVLPIIALYVGVVVVWMVVARRSTVRRPWSVRTAVATLGSLLLLLALTILPYSINTARNYGSPLYNQNTQYYLWYDTTTQAFGPAGTLLAGADAHHVTLPGGQTPSLSHYLDTHSLSAVRYRFTHGLSLEWDILAGRPIWVGYFGYGPFLLLLGGAAALAVFLNRTLVVDRVRRDWPAVAFVALSLTSLEVTIAWFTYYGAGNRYILPLALPFVVIATWCAQRGLCRWSVRLAGRAVRLDHLVLLPILAFAVRLALWASLVNSHRTLGGY